MSGKIPLKLRLVSQVAFVLDKVIGRHIIELTVFRTPYIELAVVAELDNLIIPVLVEIPICRSFRYFETQCLDEGTLGLPVLLVNVNDRFWSLFIDKYWSFFVPPFGLLSEVGINLNFLVLAEDGVEVISPAFGAVFLVRDELSYPLEVQKPSYWLLQ